MPRSQVLLFLHWSASALGCYGPKSLHCPRLPGRRGGVELGTPDLLLPGRRGDTRVGVALPPTIPSPTSLLEALPTTALSSYSSDNSLSPGDSLRLQAA